MNYKNMYEILVYGIEDAIREISSSNFGSAKNGLITALQKAEDVYIGGDDG